MLNQKITPLSPVMFKDHYLTEQQKESRSSDASPMLQTSLPVLLIKQSTHGKNRFPLNTTSLVRYLAMKKLNSFQAVDLGTMRLNLHWTCLKSSSVKYIRLPKDSSKYCNNS